MKYLMYVALVALLISLAAYEVVVNPGRSVADIPISAPTALQQEEVDNLRDQQVYLLKQYEPFSEYRSFGFEDPDKLLGAVWADKTDLLGFQMDNGMWRLCAVLNYQSRSPWKITDIRQSESEECMFSRRSELCPSIYFYDG